MSLAIKSRIIALPNPPLTACWGSPEDLPQQRKLKED